MWHGLWRRNRLSNGCVCASPQGKREHLPLRPLERHPAENADGNQHGEVRVSPHHLRQLAALRAPRQPKSSRTHHPPQPGLGEPAGSRPRRPTRSGALPRSGQRRPCDLHPVRQDFNVLLYDISTRSKTTLPKPSRRTHQYGSVVAPSGAVYVGRSGTGCGANVRIVRYGAGDPRTGTVIARLAERRDIGYMSARESEDGTVEVFSGRWDMPHLPVGRVQDHRLAKPPLALGFALLVECAVLTCLAGLAGRRLKAAAAALAELVHRRGLERANEVLVRWAS